MTSWQDVKKTTQIGDVKISRLQRFQIDNFLVQDSRQNLLSAQKASFKLLFEFSSLDSWHNEDKRRLFSYFQCKLTSSKKGSRQILFQVDWQVLKWQDSWQIKVDYFRQEDQDKFQISDFIQIPLFQVTKTTVQIP